MTEYSNEPACLLNDLLKAMETPRPLWDRVRLWLFSPLSWKATKMRSVCVHGLSTSTYARWGP